MYIKDIDGYNKSAEETQKMYKDACDLEYEFLYDDAIAILERMVEVIKDNNRKYGLPEKASIMFPYAKMGAIYLKISTHHAIRFWESLKQMPCYFQETELGGFKHIVDINLAKVLSKHSKGYSYAPKKDMREHFFDVMRSQGYR